MKKITRIASAGADKIASASADFARATADVKSRLKTSSSSSKDHHHEEPLETVEENVSVLQNAECFW